jgi:hypothetical protein
MRCRAAVAAVCLTLLTGCAVREANLRRFVDQRPPLPSERAAILREIKSTFFDPYSVRDAEISNASPSMTIDGQTMFNICLRANAKNQLGAYAGRQVTQYYFTAASELVGSNTTSAGLLCGSSELRYLPFTEAEQLGAR